MRQVRSNDLQLRELPHERQRLEAVEVSDEGPLKDRLNVKVVVRVVVRVVIRVGFAVRVWVWVWVWVWGSAPP